jgi:hypothetical protein
VTQHDRHREKTGVSDAHSGFIAFDRILSDVDRWYRDVPGPRRYLGAPSVGPTEWTWRPRIHRSRGTSPDQGLTRQYVRSSGRGS